MQNRKSARAHENPFGPQIRRESSAQRFLPKLGDQALAARLVGAMRELAENPRPIGSVKLAESDELHRIRVGDYRIVYQIQEDALLVLVS